MGYTEFTVNVDGADNEFLVFDDRDDSKFRETAIEELQKNAAPNTEIFEQYHGHPMLEDDEECQCAQYCDGDNNNYAPIWSNHD